MVDLDVVVPCCPCSVLILISTACDEYNTQQFCNFVILQHVFVFFCLSPISTVFSPESGLDYIPPSQAIPLQVSCFFLWNLFLVFLFLFFTCIFYDCHLISIDKLVEMISNNYNIQEQNGTNGSSSNGNGHPARDPYEDLVFQYFFYLNVALTETRRNRAWMQIVPLNLSLRIYNSFGSQIRPKFEPTIKLRLGSFPVKCNVTKF